MTDILVPLGDVADFVNGAAFSERDWSDDGLKIIRIQNLTDPTKPFNRTNRVVKDALHVRPGDLLVSWSATLGVFEWSGPDDALLNQHIFRVLPDSQRVSKQYLRHMLVGAVNEMDRHVHGATMKHINRAEFLGTKIPLPSIEEQRRIASILDAADALRTKRRQALAKLGTLTQAIFIDMFGDPANNANRWPTEPLGELVERGTTVTYGIVQAGDEFLGGTPYIRTGDIVEGQIRPEGLRHTNPEIARRFPRSRVATGEIVMSIRATVGTLARVPPELDGANLTQGTARIAPGEKTDGSYLVEYLRNPATQQWIQRQVKGATFREITLTRLRELPVLVPPLKLQKEFSVRVESVARLASSGMHSISNLDSLFASLQHRAFRGEL